MRLLRSFDTPDRESDPSHERRSVGDSKRPPSYCSTRDTLRDVVTLMHRHNRDDVFVITDEGVVVGMVTVRDVFLAVYRYDYAAIRDIRVESLMSDDRLQNPEGGCARNA